MKFSIRLLALSTISIVYGMSVPKYLNAKVVDATSYMAGNDTSATSDIDRRTPGNVLLCTGPNFTGNCVLITGGVNGGCIDLASDLDNQVRSFGPDPDQTCFVRMGHGCSIQIPDPTGPIRFPGVSDFSQTWVDANDQSHPPLGTTTSSYRCNFS
ncbi:hypothetical protein DFH08DRAFT_896987 [Mycena albidolilacea]|uniref:Uncharacterized protein n=1 Tax=Mycena albidolilacea TaxID=1033008 RepID=A0AAD6Z8Y7_9AGAR|nr:hypothetical protein DFH08DRAFT_896987 [Mycena albidolilacea]